MDYDVTDTTHLATVAADMAAFATRKVSNEGIRLPLALPDGTPSDRYLVVRNYRCDAYRAKLNQIRDRIAEHGKASDAQHEADRVALISSLISGWNFEMPCTPENVAAFLAEAQLVAEQVDRVAMEDERFFGKGSTPSSDGSKVN
ncbi:hypothetical protein GCM10009552_24060 [Rothia nasimurium]